MVNITDMTKQHADEVLEMMRIFYASPALLTNGSEEIFKSNIENCICDNPYLKGYVFQEGDVLAGYAMTARSFSTEFGKPCVWVEDIYLKPEYRGRGIAGKLFAFLEEKYPGAVFRLEVEAENKSAVRAYRKNGFQELLYMEMKK